MTLIEQIKAEQAKGGTFQDPAYIRAMEAALLAADELARECERVAPILAEAIEVSRLGDKHGIATSNKFRAALAAYRRAIAGGEQ